MTGILTRPSGLVKPTIAAGGPTLRNAQYMSTTSGNSLAITQPTGLQVGDVMVVWTQHSGTPSLSGWTALRATSNTGTNVASSASSWWKVADSTDVSAWSHTITFTTTFSGNAVITAWSSCSSVEASQGAGGNNNTTLNEPAFSTISANARIVHMGGTRNSLTVPTITRGVDVITGSVDGPLSGGDFGLRVTDEVQAVAGAATIAGLTGGGNGKEIHVAVLAP